MTPFKKYMGAPICTNHCFMFSDMAFFGGVLCTHVSPLGTIFKHQRVAFEVGFVSQLASAHLSVMVQV